MSSKAELNLNFSSIFPQSVTKLPTFSSLRTKCPCLELFSPNAGKCGKNADQNNFEYGHFLRIASEQY